MKATATINQVELEQKAIDSMISYEKGFITYSEMEKAVSDALRYYGSRGTGHVYNEENGEEKSIYLWRHLRGCYRSSTASICKEYILHGHCTDDYLLCCRTVMYL